VFHVFNEPHTPQDFLYFLYTMKFVNYYLEMRKHEKGQDVLLTLGGNFAKEVYNLIEKSTHFKNIRGVWDDFVNHSPNMKEKLSPQARILTRDLDKISQKYQKKGLNVSLMWERTNQFLKMFAKLNNLNLLIRVDGRLQTKLITTEEELNRIKIFLNEIGVLNPVWGGFLDEPYILRHAYYQIPLNFAHMLFLDGV